MPPFVLKDSAIRYAEQDITGILNTLRITYAAELKDNSVLGNDQRTRLPGVLDTQVSLSGFYDEAFDLELFNKIGNVNRFPLSIVPELAVEGDPGFTLETDQASYNPGADFGEMFGIQLEISGSGPLVRGTLMTKQDLTASGVGTGRQLGAIPANSRMYAALHVTANGGDGSQTIDVDVISAPDTNFDSLASNRISFSQIANANGSEFLFVDGAITDDWWRIEWTIAGTGSPSYTIFVVIGISDKK